jgi:hypothetical protein
VNFSIYLILSAALGPGVHSASDRNEYQKQRKKKKECFWKVKGGRCIGLTTLPPSVRQLSRQCEILNIPQSYRPPQPVTGIALIFFSLPFPLKLKEKLLKLSLDGSLKMKFENMSV